MYRIYKYGLKNFAPNNNSQVASVSLVSKSLQKEEVLYKIKSN